MSDYPKCKTCKHWEQAEWDDGNCTALTHGSAINCNNPNDATLLLVAEGHSQDEWGGLYTLPTFGCVLHSDLTEATP